jgi:hypothetical protein
MSGFVGVPCTDGAGVSGASATLSFADRGQIGQRERGAWFALLGSDQAAIPVDAEVWTGWI